MDIRIFLRRAFVIGGALFASIGLGTALMYLNTSVLNQLIPSAVAGAIVLVLGIGLFEWFRKLFLAFANKYFFTTLYNEQEVLERLAQEMTRTIELDKIISTITSSIGHVMGVEQYAFVLCKKEKEYSCSLQSTANLDKKSLGAIFQNQFFYKYLQTSGEALVREEIARFVEDEEQKSKHTTKAVRKSLLKVERGLANADIALCLPLVSKGQLVSVLLLGDKLSKDAFTVQDVHLLETVAHQAAVAIENATLYEEAKQFGTKLQREVERATTDLKDANEKLKELDNAKSEFMSIASHQLRTPLAGIMGYLSMISAGDYGKINPEQQPVINDVLEATKRLIRMVNIFLNATRIEAGRFVMNFTTVPFAPVIEDIYKELKPTADMKGVKLVYKKSKLPDVEVDADKIKDVILNLTDNAIKYSPKGTVTVSAEANKKTVHVMVTDTGVGIAPDEVDNLFDKFVRGSGIARVEPNGSGLGLFIAKKIVESHGGRIWAESKGEGKGSTFQFEIPLKADAAAKKKTEEFKSRAKKQETQVKESVESRSATPTPTEKAK